VLARLVDERRHQFDRLELADREPIEPRPLGRMSGLISGFGNSVTGTPLWSQGTTLAWPEFAGPVATRFEQDCRVCSKPLTRSAVQEAGRLR
jgi:hypothetical protein